VPKYFQKWVPRTSIVLDAAAVTPRSSNNDATEPIAVDLTLRDQARCSVGRAITCRSDMRGTPPARRHGCSRDGWRTAAARARRTGSGGALHGRRLPLGLGAHSKTLG
jgi:hypothetical protein